MLQRVEPEIGQLRRLGMPEHAEHAAVIVEVIVVERENFAHDAVSIAFPSDSLHVRRNESIFPRITGAPLYWIRKSPRVTLPIRRTLILYCAVIAVAWASDADASDTTARAPRSPKRANSVAS